MKKTSLVLMTLLSACLLFAAGGKANYKIVRLNTPTITIGGKSLKVGDVFSGTNDIQWTDARQAMEVRDVETGNLYVFSEKVFRSKGAARSIADFFLRTSQASSRDAAGSPTVRRSETADSYPEKRIALVIGNSNYENLSFLRNAQKDASDMVEVLSALGFDVIETYEASYEEMMTALNKFASQARNYDVALFYYAGHGTQYEGKNYLLPVNYDNTRRSSLDRSLHADDVLQRVEDSGAPVQLIFIDACRNVDQSFTRSASSGLARMEGGIGSVIVFSTQSNKTADDGDGDNSPFAASLINNLSKSASFSETMTSVVKDTYELTGHRQYPLVVGSLIQDFRFNPDGVETEKVPIPERAPSRSGPEPAAEPVRQKSPYQMFSDIPSLDASMTAIGVSGNSLIIELVLTNRSGRMLNTYIPPEESSDGPQNETMAVDKSGISYRDNGVIVTVGGNSTRNLFALPPNVPVKLRVAVGGITKTEDFAYLNLCFRGINPDIPSGIGTLTVIATEMPVPGNDFGGQRFKLTTDNPNVSVNVTRMQASGGALAIDLVLTNRTGRRISPYVDNVSDETMAVSSDGSVIKGGKMYFSVGDKVAGNFFVLPAGVPVRLRVLVNGVRSAEQLAYLNVCLRHFNPDAMANGMGQITLTKE